MVWKAKLDEAEQTLQNNVKKYNYNHVRYDHKHVSFVCQCEDDHGNSKEIPIPPPYDPNKFPIDGWYPMF